MSGAIRLEKGRTMAGGNASWGNRLGWFGAIQGLRQESPLTSWERKERNTPEQ